MRSTRSLLYSKQQSLLGGMVYIVTPGQDIKRSIDCPLEPCGSWCYRPRMLVATRRNRRPFDGALIG